MEDKHIFSQILGISSPWFISDISLNREEGRIDILVDHLKGVEFPCPKCEKYCGIYDHSKPREFRHLDTCQMATYIHVRLPRISCETHGVQQIASGLGNANSKVTFEFENLVLDLERECSIESVSRILKVDWHTCWKIMERGVARGKERKPQGVPERIGVDEKSFAKGHKYETIVHDIDKATVEYVCDDREQASLESYYGQFSTEELSQIRSVSMDMWDAYIAATKAYVPGADDKVVFDKFHVMRMALDAVDKVRKKEHRELMEQDNPLLKGTKYLWLWNEENIPSFRRSEFNTLRSMDLKVSRARAIKDNLRHLWNYTAIGWMCRYFKRWYFWATHSRLKPIIAVAKTIKRHLQNILTYAKHQITNALGESLNSKIEKVKRLACGFRNRDHYRTAIYFHCGGLDVYPRRSSIAMQVMTP